MERRRMKAAVLTGPQAIEVKEVPVPVKIVESTMTEQAKAVADYWQAAANDKNAVERFAPEGGEILAAAVVTEEGNYDYALPATTNMIWDFMGQFYRYGGGVLSNAKIGRAHV